MPLNISEWAYGQWGNLAGYIYGTAVLYSLKPHVETPENQAQEDDDELKNASEKGNEADEDSKTEQQSSSEGVKKFAEIWKNMKKKPCKDF